MVYFGGFIAKLDMHFAGFSPYSINNAVRISEAAMGGPGDIILNETKKKLGRMVAAVYTLILKPNRSKKVWPPRKSPQNDGYVHIINTLYMSVIQQPV